MAVRRRENTFRLVPVSSPRLKLRMNLFRNVSDASTFDPGTMICREGDAGDSMYAIVEGEVEVLLGDHVIEVLGPGDFFGEMSLIDQSPRSASARAKTACRVAVIDERRFGYMVQQTPYFALEILRTLTTRLRRRLGEMA